MLVLIFPIFLVLLDRKKINIIKSNKITGIKSNFNNIKIKIIDKVKKTKSSDIKSKILSANEVNTFSISFKDRVGSKSSNYLACLVKIYEFYKIIS